MIKLFKKLKKLIAKKVKYNIKIKITELELYNEIKKVSYILMLLFSNLSLVELF